MSCFWFRDLTIEGVEPNPGPSKKTAKRKATRLRARARTAGVSQPQSSSLATSAGGRLLPFNTVWRSSLEGPFPPKLRTRLRMQSQGTYDANSAAGDGNAFGLTFKGNSPLSCGASSNYPLGTAGAFSGNVPAGIAMLLGSDPAGGATAPYGNFLVHGSSIEIELVPTAASVPISVIICPQDTGPASTMTTQTLAENPYAVRMVLPTSFTATIPCLRNSITTERLLGVPAITTANGPRYTGTYNADPAYLWYWTIQLNNITAATTRITMAFRVTITYDIEFYDLNTLSSVTPT